MSEGIDFRLISIEKNMEKILNLLTNDENGLVTKVALQQQRITEIPSPNELKYWSALGGGIVSALGIITWLIFKAFKTVV